MALVKIMSRSTITDVWLQATNKSLDELVESDYYKFINILEIELKQELAKDSPRKIHLYLEIKTTHSERANVISFRAIPCLTDWMEAQIGELVVQTEVFGFAAAWFEPYTQIMGVQIIRRVR